MKELKFEQNNYIEGVCIMYNQKESEKIMELKKMLNFCLYKLKVRTSTGKYTFLSLIDIYYFEVVDGQCYIYGEKEIYTGLVSFKQFKEELVGNGFLQCNKIQIINENHLKDLKMSKECQRVAELDNGDMILVSRKYKNEIDMFRHPNRVSKVL